MRRLDRTIRKSVRQGNLFPATVLDVHGDGRATVRLSGNGTRLRNLQIVGGLVAVGDSVMVDFGSYSPVIEAPPSREFSNEFLQEIYDALKRDGEYDAPGTGGQASDLTLVRSILSGFVSGTSEILVSASLDIYLLAAIALMQSIYAEGDSSSPPLLRNNNTNAEVSGQLMYSTGYGDAVPTAVNIPGSVSYETVATHSSVRTSYILPAFVVSDAHIYWVITHNSGDYSVREYQLSDLSQTGNVSIPVGYSGGTGAAYGAVNIAYMSERRVAVSYVEDNGVDSTAARLDIIDFATPARTRKYTASYSTDHYHANGLLHAVDMGGYAKVLAVFQDEDYNEYTGSSPAYYNKTNLLFVTYDEDSDSVHSSNYWHILPDNPSETTFDLVKFGAPAVTVSGYRVVFHISFEQYIYSVQHPGECYIVDYDMNDDTYATEHIYQADYGEGAPYDASPTCKIMTYNWNDGKVYYMLRGRRWDTTTELISWASYNPSTQSSTHDATGVSSLYMGTVVVDTILYLLLLAPSGTTMDILNTAYSNVRTGVNAYHTTYYRNYSNNGDEGGLVWAHTGTNLVGYDPVNSENDRSIAIGIDASSVSGSTIILTASHMFMMHYSSNSSVTLRMLRAS